VLEELHAASRISRGFAMLAAMFMLRFVLFHADAAVPRKFGPYQN
jgi:hypothetical protein